MFSIRVITILLLAHITCCQHIFWCTLVSSKSYILPSFLASIEQIDYPKRDISLLFLIDHNTDNSYDIIQTWAQDISIRELFRNIKIIGEQFETSGEIWTNDLDVYWSRSHMSHVISLRQKCLDYSRSANADYLFMVDADNFLTETAVLQYLIATDTTLVAPMLNVVNGVYSNFWGAIDPETGYYKRSDDYLDVVNRVKRDFRIAVPVVHSTFLLNLKAPESRLVSYTVPSNYKGALDDMVLFSQSARQAGIQPYLNNERFWGFMLPEFVGYQEDYQEFVHAKLYYLAAFNYLLPSSEIIMDFEIPYVPVEAIDKVFVINLKRRPDRLFKMSNSLKTLKMEYEVFEAYDGKQLNINELIKSGVSQLPSYEDPYHKRPLKLGEIGCFLSHYEIWKKVIDNNWSSVLILEDDILFHKNFRLDLERLIYNLATFVPDWELAYLGRKYVGEGQEFFVEGTQSLVWPGYSYWTLGYLITRSGAEKLYNQNPLNRLLAIDEFLPIMYDRHPNEQWKTYFEPRDLIAVSAYPLLIEPLFYTGENDYITDTEDSELFVAQDSRNRSGGNGGRGLRGDVGEADVLAVSDERRVDEL